MTAEEVGELLRSALGHLQDGGKLSPFAALSQVYSTVDLRSSVTPEVHVDIAGLGAQGGPPSALKAALLKVLRPTLVAEGPAGRWVLAPGGEAAPGRAGAVGLVVLLSAVLGGALVAGYWLGKGSST